MSTKICKQSAYVNTLKSNTVHVGKSKKNLNCPTKTCAELGSLNRPVESLREAIQLVKDKKMENVSVLMAAGDYSKTDFDLEIPKEIRQIIGEGRSVTTIGNGLQIKHSLDLQDLTIGTDPSKMAITIYFTTGEILRMNYVGTTGASSIVIEGTIEGTRNPKVVAVEIYESSCEQVAASTRDQLCTSIELRNGVELKHVRNQVTQYFRQGDDDGKPLRQKIVDATSSIQSSISDSETKYEICKAIDTINHHDIQGKYEHKRNNTQRRVEFCPGSNLTKDVSNALNALTPVTMVYYLVTGQATISCANSSVEFGGGLESPENFVAKVDNNGNFSSKVFNRTVAGASGVRSTNVDLAVDARYHLIAEARYESFNSSYKAGTDGILTSKGAKTTVTKGALEIAADGYAAYHIQTLNGARTTVLASKLDAEDYAFTIANQDESSTTEVTLNAAVVRALGSFYSPTGSTVPMSFLANSVTTGTPIKPAGLAVTSVSSFENTFVKLFSVQSTDGELRFVGGTQAIMDDVGLNDTVVKSLKAGLNTALKNFRDEETGNRPIIEFLKSRSSNRRYHNFELEHGTTLISANSILNQQGPHCLVCVRAQGEENPARLSADMDLATTVEFAASQLNQNSPTIAVSMIQVQPGSTGLNVVVGTSSFSGNYNRVLENDDLNPTGTLISSGSNLLAGSRTTYGVLVQNVPDNVIEG